MPAKHYYIRSDDILFQEVDDEGILLNVGRGQYLRVNSTATEVWHELDEPSSAIDIANRLGRKYDCAPNQLQSDINQVLEEMSRLGVVIETIPTDL